MSVFNLTDFDNHEQVTFFHDEPTGLKAIIAIHNTNLGPALGGCRFWNYASDDEALKDALRLSRGMTYKSALANLDLGGGKAVIIGDARTQKTPELLRAFGRFINRLNGLYITAEDVGTSPKDMDIIRTQTPHVVGLDTDQGGSGDPSIMTAYGTLMGMKACVERVYKSQSFSGLRIALQGLGHVGLPLAQQLHDLGAHLIISDIHADSLKIAEDRFQATIVKPDDIYDVDCDIFSPCALGGVVNDQTLDRLKCKIIAGSANNQLAEGRHGLALRRKGILYAPDYLINAGGIINVTYEGPTYNKEKVLQHVNTIYDTLIEIIDLADKMDISTNAASDRIAEQRFKQQDLKRIAL